MAVATNVCSSMTIDEAMARYEAVLDRCHVKRTANSQPILSGNLVVGYTKGGYSMYALEKQASPTLGSLVLRSIQNGNIMLIADIHQTSACKSAIELRGSNFAWQSWARRAQTFADDPNASCPIM